MDSNKITKKTVNDAVFKDYTALMYAVQDGCIDTISILLDPKYKNKVDINYINNMRNDKGLNALGIARSVRSRRLYRKTCSEIYKTESDDAINQYAKCEAEWAQNYNEIIFQLEKFEEDVPSATGCGCNTVGR